MKLSQEQQEKLTLAIQAALGVLVIGLSVRNTAKAQTSQAKKFARKNARQAAKLNRTEYRLRTKLLKQKYRTKLRQAKMSGKKSA